MIKEMQRLIKALEETSDIQLKYDKHRHHLTAIDNRNIKYLLEKGINDAKIKRKEYHIEDKGNGEIVVKIIEMERNMIGSDLKPKVYTIPITVIHKK